jgi:hypothetical protein
LLRSKNARRGRSAAFLDIAEGLGLGVVAREKIKIMGLSLSKYGRLGYNRPTNRKVAPR